VKEQQIGPLEHGGILRDWELCAMIWEWVRIQGLY
jgi:hypothetical protein